MQTDEVIAVLKDPSIMILPVVRSEIINRLELLETYQELITKLLIPADNNAGLEESVYQELERNLTYLAVKALGGKITIEQFQFQSSLLTQKYEALNAINQLLKE